MKKIFSSICWLIFTLIANVGFAQMGGMMGDYGKGSDSSNGERIYYTGVSGRTGPIPFQGGPMWLRMQLSRN